MIHLFIGAVAGASLLCGCNTIHPKQMTDLSPVLQGCSNKFEGVIVSPESFRAQVLISEVVTNTFGQTTLKRHGYRVGAEYFYPASTVKLCAAVVALQAVEKLQPPSLATDLADVPMEIAPLFPGDAPQISDASNVEGGHITVALEMRKISLVSDNQAFNRLYDLVGHEQLNRAMHDLGLRSVVINHRLSETRTIPDMRASAAVTFRVVSGEAIAVPSRNSKLMLTNDARNLLVGNGYMKGKDLVQTPMDFSARNGISLVDLQDLLVKVARPDIDLGTPPLKLTTLHRARLLQAMTEYPRESANPAYAAKDYPDEYSKFLLPGLRRVFPSMTPGERVDSTGKIGRAYGFSIEYL
jgi:Beta-lactamase enzyme family